MSGESRLQVIVHGAAKVCGVTALAVALGCALPADRTAHGGKRPSIMKPPFEVGSQAREMRLVSLTPSLTETVFALKAQDLLVGVTDNDHYPQQAEGLPSVGDMYPNLELIVASCPDLVLLDKQLMKPETLHCLETLQVNVLALAQNNLQQVRDNLPVLGQALHRERQAEVLVNHFDKTIKVLAKNRALLKNKPRTFVSIWSSPLTTASKSSFINELLELAGADNIFSDLPLDYPQVSTEQLIALDPEVIIVSYEQAAQACQAPGWRQLSAVKNNHVFYIDPDLIQRPSVRSLQGALKIQECLLKARH